jgi:hypothetical protein
MRLQILVPSARRYGSTFVAASRMVARSTPSSSAQRSSGAAIGRPTSGSCQVPTRSGYRTHIREGISNAAQLVGPLRAWVGRAGAATQRNLGDSSGQQGITNLQVSGHSERLTWAAKPLDWAFTRQRPQVRTCHATHHQPVQAYCGPGRSFSSTGTLWSWGMPEDMLALLVRSVSTPSRPATPRAPDRWRWTDPLI